MQEQLPVHHHDSTGEEGEFSSLELQDCKHNTSLTPDKGATRCTSLEF